MNEEFKKLLLKNYENWGIAKKVLVILLLNSVIPILLIAVIACIISMNMLENKTDELMESNLMLAQKGIEDYFMIYDRMILSIYSNNEYAEYLSKLNVWDTKNYYLKKNQLESDLQDLAYNYPDILGIGVVTNKKEIILFDSITLSSTSSYCFPKGNKEWYSVIEETYENSKTVYSKPIRREDGDFNNLIYISHRLMNIDNYSKGVIGSIIICIPENSIRNIYFQNTIDDKDLTFLCNKNGEIISSSNEEFIGLSLLNEPLTDENVDKLLKNSIEENNLIKSNKISIYNRKIRNGEFYLVSVQDKSELLKDSKMIALIVILIGVITIIISCLIAFNFSNSIKECVKKIVDAMNQAYNGDYNVQILSSRKDEFGIISSNFNHMVRKINESLKQEKKALIREKNAEIRALESQINPHFLYNTLDAINWMAIENEQFEISKMLKSLATILRYSIKNSNQLVTIENELEYLKKYIYLQQQRFEDSFQCYIDVDNDLLVNKIHKLLFQPLIENSIIHAFHQQNNKNKILISIKRKNEKCIEIIVADNGCGMEDDLVKKFNEFDFQNGSVESSVGICNVIMRVKYYYGNNGFFFIKSDSNGTEIKIQIPIE